MARTKIERADKVWNPVTGCTKVSPGCANCYAERMVKRLAGRAGYSADNPFAVTLHEDKLDEPLRWRKPARVFVCGMGDLFHEDVPDRLIWQVWDVMAYCMEHRFMVLTKRPERMRRIASDLANFYGGGLDNVWLGVTAENEEMADERIPRLLETPAAKRFVSVEPCLGQIDLTEWLGEGLDLVILGGETGPRARPMHSSWVRRVCEDCEGEGAPFFFKQWGEWFPRDQWEFVPLLELPDDDYAYDPHPDDKRNCVLEAWDGWMPMHRVGKRAAGCLLDGRRWDGDA